MLWSVLLGFLFAPVAPLLYPHTKHILGWLIPLIPLALFGYFVSQINPITDGEIITESYEWVPSLGINLDFRLDGLSLIFALLITGVGTLVFTYAGGYLHYRLGTFYLYLLMFMASMLGVVLADNMLLVFVFWELTSISSYLLISFYNNKDDSREAAKTALIVTGASGLALLAGLTLFGIASETWSLGTAIETFDHHHKLYMPILILIAIGAFGKSAQFPFHFWLPMAMAAPAPVSSYLHSATMVKAGVYLLARMHPALGHTDEWHLLITTIGGITMIMGGYLAWQQTDIKRVLAYTTISALGILVFLLGIGSGIAVKAALVFVVVHALYKCALFMVGGTIDHETGTRDLDHLGGLSQKMPYTAGAAAIAALSMAGLPPLFGFIGKELIYEATLEAKDLPVLGLTVAAFIANLFNVTAAGMVAITPFYGEEKHTPKHAHEAPASMWVPPLILGAFSLGLGLFSVQLYEPILEPMVEAVYGNQYEVHLGLWHGFNTMFALSIVTILGGAGLYMMIQRLRPTAHALDVGTQFGPAVIYQRGFMDGFLWLANQFRQQAMKAHLRYYVRIIVVTVTVAVLSTLLPAIHLNELIHDLDEVRLYELLFMAFIIICTVAIPFQQSRRAVIALLGMVGFVIAVMFLLFSAPDLSMTQFAIETLTVILFVLVIYRLPQFRIHSSMRTRTIDAVLSIAFGGMITLLVLIIINEPFQSQLATFFVENSYKVAKGHNVVNVILVDFRGFDTMGEITVLAIAAIGVFALLKLNVDPIEPEE